MRVFHIETYQDSKRGYRASLLSFDPENHDDETEEASAIVMRVSFESDEDFQDAVDNAKTQLNQSLEENQ